MFMWMLLPPRFMVFRFAVTNMNTDFDTDDFFMMTVNDGDNQGFVASPACIRKERHGAVIID